MNKDYTVHTVDWGNECPAIRLIRETVFIHEQKVPGELEWDGLDTAAFHVLAVSADRQPVGTGRLLHSGQIGRMAVLREHRGNGIGSAILKTLLQLADAKKISGIFLNAQLQAVPFYRQHGFTEAGKHFNEAGIVHCRMDYRP